MPYAHIDRILDEANQKMRRIALGIDVPLVTHLTKERDNIGGFFGGEQVVVAGRTGTGKSAKVTDWTVDFHNPILNPFYAGRVVTLWDSWEMQAWRNVVRMFSNYSSRSVAELTAFQEGRRLTEEELRYYENEVSSAFRGKHIYFSQMSESAQEWLDNKYSAMENAKKKIGRDDLLFVNVIDHTRLAKKSKEKSEEELITAMQINGMNLRNDTKYNVINIFLSQMNRKIEEGADRDDPIKLGLRTPIATDIFGADSVFQCADVVLALHRPGVYGVDTWQFERDGPMYDVFDNEGNDRLMLHCLLKHREGTTGKFPVEHRLKYSQFLDFDFSQTSQQMFRL